MSETTKKTTEIKNEEVKQELSTEVETEIVVEKPYTFRRLSSPDIFPMLRIIGKIGIKEFTAAIDKNVLMELIAEFTAENAKGNEESTEEATEEAENAKGNIFGAFAVNGATVILGIADVIISKLPSCENDIYQILSQTSNLSVDEIKALDAAVFFGMVIDFIMKEEFKDFIKVVSRLFK